MSTTMTTEGVRLIKTSALYDIVVDSETGSEFYKYEDKQEIGKKIFASLYETFKNVNGTWGFTMTDGSNEIGILSQCQSLQAMMLLVSEFGLGFDDTAIISDEHPNKPIREIMDLVIEDVLDRVGMVAATRVKIEAGEDSLANYHDSYKFDMSPYKETFFRDSRKCSIEAIRWVLPTFLLVLKYHAVTMHEICRFEEYLVSVIRFGLKYLNESFIDRRNEQVKESGAKLLSGWNFTGNCEEPSLYFTFAVCECWLDMYNTFGEYMEYCTVERNKNILDNLIAAAAAHNPEDPAAKIRRKYLYDSDGKIVSEHKKHRKDYDEHKDDPIIPFTRQNARYDKYNELIRVYTRICGKTGDEDYCAVQIDGTVFGELRDKITDVADTIWALVKDRFDSAFFFNDLSATITENDLRMSTTSDALFNSMYIINIMLAGGVDMNFQQLARLAELSKQETKQKEHDAEYTEFLEICQLAIQKAFRTYENLKKDGRDYIVDQFLVGFNEKFTVHKEATAELRKLRMRVFSLLPLLIRTNNSINTYLIKYPQSNMSKYLGYILDNRKIVRRNNKEWKEWIWESDGFFSASNYYYVYALGQFYDYYATYEEKYISNATDNEKARKAIREEYKRELTESGEIYEKQKLINEQAAKIAELTAELAAKQSPVENEIRKLIDSVIATELESKISDTVCNLFNQSAEQMFSVGSGAQKTATPLATAVMKMFFSMYSCELGKHIKSKTPEAYAELTDKFNSEIQYLFSLMAIQLTAKDGAHCKLADLLRDGMNN